MKLIVPKELCSAIFCEGDLVILTDEGRVRLMTPSDLGMEGLKESKNTFCIDLPPNGYIVRRINDSSYLLVNQD